MVNSQEKLSCQIETHGKSTQENLAQHLDSVEVNIADQVAQKSHHFFHVSFDIFTSKLFFTNYHFNMFYLKFTGYDIS